ncbi:MAG TPA: patatin-like phospholipase family protein [Pseudomonadales bacterium]|nr:patatin-like phospholipase family protein [Pseudomonadales bacterium]
MKNFLLLVLILLAAVGCSSTASRHPVPENLVSQADVPGFPGDRMIQQTDQIKLQHFDELLGNAVTRAQAMATNHPLTQLALSGGGSRGAYGAGLLCGWTEKGDRPEFDIVTGISTGALMGPYAFLGPAYDKQLKTAYTTATDEDIYAKRGKLKILFGADSVLDTAPLAKRIKEEITPAMFDAIAAEYRKGRRFYVGTCDLDDQSLWIWDMGAIAASGRPDAHDLFCKVLLASASIPVAFPPVMFKVQVDDKSYDEMDVDGGVMTQVFGAVFLDRLMHLSHHMKGELYIIRNECISPDWKAVKPQVLPIAGRTVGSLIKTQGLGDLYRLFVVSELRGMDFNLATIPESFDMEPETEFDPKYMSALFELGYDQAIKGTAWTNSPPGYNTIMQ